MQKNSIEKKGNPIEVDCCFSRKTGLWTIKDKVSKKILLTELRMVRRFKGGLAAIQTFEGLWGFMNKKGHITIGPDFNEVTDFQNGYAKVKINKKIKKINTKGEEGKSPEDYQKEWAKKIQAKKPKKKLRFLNEHDRSRSYKKTY